MSDDEIQEVNALQPSVIDLSSDAYFGSHSLEAVAHVQDDKDIIIALNNIHKTYLLGLEGVPALRGVSVTIKRGEFVCVFGTSGGGKTSLLNIIGTIDKPTKGELFIAGTRIGSNTPDKDLADLRLHRIGFVFQTFNLLASLSAVENVEMPMILDGHLSRSERRARAIELLTIVGMQDRLDHLPAQLSGGEQQRVTIARSIANRPDILLLDEPTGDLDTVNTAIVMKLLSDLNKKEGITMVMVTHDVGLKYFANRIIWIRDGKIQRIENVRPEKQNETLEQLERHMKELGIEEEEEEAVKEEEEEYHNFRTTEMRDPNFYPTNSRHDKDAPHKLSAFAQTVKESQKSHGRMAGVTIHS